MAQESCKDEAEILKPSSSPSPSNPPPSQSPPNTTMTSPSQSAPAVCLKPPFEFSAQKPVISDVSFTLKDEKERRESQPPVKFANRCSSCRKKVGLTGFRCRCGELFCPRHRYSETHDCSFDYKALGREEISKANPLIRAAKIIKI